MLKLFKKKLLYFQAKIILKKLLFQYQHYFKIKSKPYFIFNYNIVINTLKKNVYMKSEPPQYYFFI